MPNLTPKFEIIRKEVDDSHYYFIDNEFYPAVTAILDEAAPVPWALKDWFKRMTPDEINGKQKESLEFGSKIHDAIEKLLNGFELNLLRDYPSTREKKHIVAFAQWYLNFKPKVIATENTVASKKYKYAGTLDLLCQVGDTYWIVDFKTSAGVYESYHWQLAAYRQAVLETYGIAVEKSAILRTGTKHKSGYEFVEGARPFDEFKKIYDIYISLHNGEIPKPPMIDVYPETLKLEDYQ
jgi:hypothetical protein